MIGPFRLVVVVTLLLCSLAGSVMASIKADCTVYPSRRIDCIVDFGIVADGSSNCNVKGYINDRDVPLTINGRNISMAIPDGVVDISKINVILNSGCGSIEVILHKTMTGLTATATTPRTSRGGVINTTVKANCTVYPSRKIECIVDFGIVDHNCKVEKSFVNEHAVLFTINGRNISMVIPAAVGIRKSKVTLLPNCSGPVVANMTHIPFPKPSDQGEVVGDTTTAQPPDIPQGTVVAVVCSIAVAIIGLIAGVHVLKRRRDARTRDQQTANTQEEDLEELERQALSTSSKETSA